MHLAEVWAKCVGQLFLQVNKVSLSLCHALGGFFQVLSNRNSWSRRSAGGNKGATVYHQRERLKETLLSCALRLKPLSGRNSQKHRALLCAVCVRGLCLKNLQVHNLQRMWLYMPVMACVRTVGTVLMLLFTTACQLIFFLPLILHYTTSIHE